MSLLERIAENDYEIKIINKTQTKTRRRKQKIFVKNTLIVKELQVRNADFQALQNKKKKFQSRVKKYTYINIQCTKQF